MAHGLKTPLTVLAAPAGRLQRAGDPAGAEPEALAYDKLRHIHRELARAHLASPATRGAATALAPLVDRLVATLARTPRGERLAWENSIPKALTVAVDADDLAELLGNLFDNAAKWGRDTVAIQARAFATRVVVEIVDDGRGVADMDRAKLGSRFMRLDATTPGHRIGQAYGGSMVVAASPRGGLSVSLDLPAAQPATGQPSRR